MHLTSADARRTVKAMLEQVQRADPVRLALPRVHRDSRNVGFVAVYRATHAHLLHEVVRRLDDAVTVRLWSLDSVPPALRTATVGQGPGSRFTLLNRLIGTIPEAARRDGLVLSDDDYSFRVGSLPQLLAVGRAAGLDVWQPAHARNSWVSYPFVRRRWGTLLRRTTFVEQGPVVVLSAAGQRALLPLPEDLGMAWGAEIGWSQAAAAGVLDLGIVDAVAINHRAPLGGYDRSEQAAQLEAMLAEVGVSSLRDLQVELAHVGLREGRRLLKARGAP